MGSDRARVSYDRSRHWRGVVGQQGRVTLEADWNEAATIAAEENREQLLDVVGPAGTPDDGYRVVPATNADNNFTGDLTIGRGTMYVGGERMVLDADVDYAQQADWLDNEGDPLWVEPAREDPNADEVVYLLLREQEVSAVEDPALLDVALGGPDTTQRLRIVQRVVRHATDDPTCAGSLGVLQKAWAEDGLEFDAATRRLASHSTLQVSFQQSPKGATPCEPVAQGGYLGAENQLIRVQVASVDEQGEPTLVWGFDNASFLYRVTADPADASAGTTVLKLASAPVDSFHQPAKGQTVEVLRAAAQLTPQDAVAATTGVVTTVDTAYQPDTQQVVVASALGPPTTGGPVLFLRVWQETIAGYAGGPVPLGDTGVQVTLDPGGAAYHAGDYWLFAVRPGTPTEVSPVYPERILEAPQPPDGPRLWACSLAVVRWESGVPSVVDCRHHFDDLVTLTEQGGECCVDVSVAGVDGGAGLQPLIDRYANQGPVTFCLRPGTYKLPRPLVITKAHVGVTIQSCAPGVIIEADDGTAPQFVLGLILLEAPRNFTLRGVDLLLPVAQLQVKTTELRTAIAGLPKERQPLFEAYLRRLRTSFGVYALGGRELRIEGCTFRFQSSELDVFGAAVFGTRSVRRLELVDNVFVATEAQATPFAALASGQETDGAVQIRFGYLQVPTRAQDVSFEPLAGTVEQRAGNVVLKRSAARQASTKAAATAAAAILLPTLADASVERNLFAGVTVPLLALGHVGSVVVDDNSVGGSYGGFWLVNAANTSVLTLLERLGSVNTLAREALAAGALFSLGDPVLLVASVVGRLLPLTPDAQDPAGAFGMILAPQKAVLSDAELVLRRLYTTRPADLQQFVVQPEVVVTDQPVTPDVAPTTNVASAEAAPAQPAAPIVEATAELPKELVNVFKSPTSTAGLALAAALPVGLETHVAVNRNDVDAAGGDSGSGPGLLVLTLDPNTPNSVVCSANRIRSRAPRSEAVALWEVLESTVTGNIISNESGGDSDRSILLVPRVPGKIPAVAVTGNVFVGPVFLPSRPLPAPFNTWLGLNTVMPVS